jgi:hypothetical protein
MADAKYGRLFTETDVRLLMREAANEQLRHPEGQWGSVDAAEALDRFTRAAADTLELPADEPMVLLRGNDLAAAGTAWTYAWEAHRIGASVDAVTDLMRMANDMRYWAEQNRDRMEAPWPIERTRFSVEQMRDAVEYAVTLAWEPPEPTAPPVTVDAIATHVLRNAQGIPGK